MIIILDYRVLTVVRKLLQVILGHMTNALDKFIVDFEKLGAVVAPEGIEIPVEDVTPDRFRRVFAPLIAQPAFLETVKLDEAMLSPAREERYHKSVELARDTIYDGEDGTKRQKELADHQLLNSIFAGSDGSEGRLVLGGFKPMRFGGLSYSRDGKKLSWGPIPIDKLVDHAVVTYTDLYDGEACFTFGGLDSLQHRSYYNAGYLGNIAALGAVIRHNEDLLGQLGHDISLSPEEFADSVLKSGDPVAESILLGYAPLSSIFFYVQRPGDIGIPLNLSKFDNGFHRESVERFWERLPLILNDEQLAIARTVALNPSLGESLGVIDGGVTNSDYIDNSVANNLARTAFDASGISAYVQGWRARLYGSRFPFLQTQL